MASSTGFLTHKEEQLIDVDGRRFLLGCVLSDVADNSGALSTVEAPELPHGPKKSFSDNATGLTRFLHSYRVHHEGSLRSVWADVLVSAMLSDPDTPNSKQLQPWTRSFNPRPESQVQLPKASPPRSVS